jgi:hypothetical protein
MQKKTTFQKKVWLDTLKHNNNPNQKQFEEDLALFIAKELVPLSFVEAPFLKRLVIVQNSCLVFPSR